jgi:hypothetical protein
LDHLLFHGHLRIHEVRHTFRPAESMAAYMGIGIMGCILRRRANRWAAVSIMAAAMTENLGTYSIRGAPEPAISMASAGPRGSEAGDGHQLILAGISRGPYRVRLGTTSLVRLAVQWRTN